MIDHNLVHIGLILILIFCTAGLSSWVTGKHIRTGIEIGRAVKDNLPLPGSDNFDHIPVADDEEEYPDSKVGG